MGELFKKVHDTLPVFNIDHNATSILYTPGYFMPLRKFQDGEMRQLLTHPFNIPDDKIKTNILDILKYAREACDTWLRLQQKTFVPECLTIHSGSDCNLNCSYCYSKRKDTENSLIAGFPSIESTIRVFNSMIERYRGTNQKITIAYHGAGEPTLHWKELTETHKQIAALAKKNSVGIFNYIATNGCLNEAQIEWLANHMDLIGISCDGPPDIQQHQRKSAEKSLIPIPEVCNMIHEKGGQFDIRVTITRNTIARQLEITHYLIGECRAKNIRIEPVYLAGEKALTVHDAGSFVENFMMAMEYAGQHNVELSYSGVRLEEIHGSYCDVLRNTLRLTSDGMTRNCFCFMRNSDDFITGRYDQDNNSFSLSPSLKEINRTATIVPPACSDCINVLHCSRGCPDFCIFTESNRDTMQLNEFRCNLNQRMTVEKIKQMVDKNTSRNGK